MKLSRTERLMLVNQYRSLEHVDPDQADFYKQAQDAFQQGFEREYDAIASFIDTDILSESECEEVIDILSMFDALGYAYRELQDKSGIEERDIEFSGFDGNNEGKQLRYWRYLYMDDRFRDLGEPRNSHMPTLARYRRMLDAYERGNKGIRLTRADIQRVIEASQLGRA